jgi:hypothetical protein
MSCSSACSPRVCLSRPFALAPDGVVAPLLSPLEELAVGLVADDARLSDEDLRRRRLSAALVDAPFARDRSPLSIPAVNRHRPARRNARRRPRCRRDSLDSGMRSRGQAQRTRTRRPRRQLRRAGHQRPQELTHLLITALATKVTFCLVGPDPSAVNALNSRSLIADAPPSPQRGPSPVRGGPAAPRVPTASGSPPHCPDAPSRPAARAAPPRRAVQVAVWTPRPQPLGQSAGASCAAVWPSSRSVSRRSPGSCIPTMSGPPICHWICWASTPSSCAELVDPGVVHGMTLLPHDDRFSGRG